MKENINNANLQTMNNELEVSCGNCWGHQEYTDEYVRKAKDVNRSGKENFIRRFVNKYIRKAK